MATIDTTLDNLLIPDLPTYNQEFGVKKTDGKGLSTEEVAKNIQLPFNRQRPFIITENSETTEIQSNCLFVINATEKVALKLNNGQFVGLEVQIVNNTDIKHSISFVVNSELKTFEILPKTRYTTQWLGNSWFESLPTGNENILGKVGLLSGQPTDQNIVIDKDFSITPKYLFNMLTGNQASNTKEVVFSSLQENLKNKLGNIESGSNESGQYIKIGGQLIIQLVYLHPHTQSQNYLIPFNFPPVSIASFYITSSGEQKEATSTKYNKTKIWSVINGGVASDNYMVLLGF